MWSAGYLLHFLSLGALLVGTLRADEFLEKEFRSPKVRQYGPAICLRLTSENTGAAPLNTRLEEILDTGIGCALALVDPSVMRPWDILSQLWEHARYIGLELGLGDFPVATPEAYAPPPLRNLSWLAYPFAGPCDNSAEMLPLVFQRDASCDAIATLVAPALRTLQTHQYLYPTRTPSVPEGEWLLLRFGVAEIVPRTPDFHDHTQLALHVNSWLAACQERFRHGYGRDLLWYRLSFYDGGGLVWPEGLPAAFLEKGGDSLEQYLPVLAGITVGNPAQSERALSHLSLCLRSLWRKSVAEKIDELVHAAGLEAGISIDESCLSPEEVAVYFKRPEIKYSAGLTAQHKRIRAAGGGRVMGRRKIIGHLKLGDVEPSGAESIMPFPWKHAVDRLLADGATLILLDTESANSGTTRGLVELRELCSYLQRCHTMLQRGESVADLLVLTDRPLDALSGYACDYANEKMLKGAEVQHGRVCFESENSYTHLAVNANLLQRENVGKTVRRLADHGVALWRVDGAQQVAGERTVTSIHKLFPESTSPLPMPDFSWSSTVPGLKLRFQHRRTELHDIYFTVNDSLEAGPVTIIFRDHERRSASRWNPLNGEVASLADQHRVMPDGRVAITTFMEPFDSCFIVFQ